jgi:NAD-dependent SIR2 family protein deacetylase
MSTDDPTHQLAEALRAGGPTLVLTGAGISLASGIPTFRGTDAGAVDTAEDVLPRVCALLGARA